MRGLVALVDVTKSPKPIYANTNKGKEIFYVRAGNTTRILTGGDILAYVSETWGLD